MFVSELLPANIDPDLSLFLRNNFIDINIALGNVNQIERINAIPDKLSIGKIYYFNNAIPTTPITSEGWWGFKSTGWVNIA